MNIHITLRDQYGNTVEDRILTPKSAAKKAARFVYLQGSDPDYNGRDATHGSIHFEPTNDEPDSLGAEEE